MKKILLSTAALAGLAMVAAAPVRADEPALQLGVGGYISGYAVYTDQDGAAGDSRRSFDFRKDTEVHLNGEVALDNGITAGAHMELLMDRADSDNTVEESYMYLSSSWGRVNFGEEDGIAYLLQVAAPSADDKIDGIRPDVNTIDYALLSSTGGSDITNLEYAQDTTGYTNKFTYITPVFNGFQAGVSYTPTVTHGVALVDLDALDPVESDDDAGDLQNAWELAARYEGSFDALDVALGAGYTTASLEEDASGLDDLQEWNVGANIGWGAFGLGASYSTSNNGQDNDGDTKIWVAGADYTMGAYKFGVSYLNRQDEVNALANPTGDDTELDRWTAGTVYEWGPGMTFRGAVSYVDMNTDVAGDQEDNATQVTLGTQLNF